MNIFLIGYRGTGKSTVGQLLADRLDRIFADTDDGIELVAGITIAEIFAEEGESSFRDHESALLAELCQLPDAVISTGGGIILRPANRERLTKFGFVVWLTASPETVWRRMVEDPTTAGRRPNLTAAGGLDEVKNLMAEREPLYRATASVIVPTDDRSPDAVVADILAAWDTRPGKSPSSSS